MRAALAAVAVGVVASTSIAVAEYPKSAIIAQLSNECVPIDQMEGLTINKLRGINWHEVNKSARDRFNSKEPKTSWTRVYLVDMPDGSGVVLAGYDSNICATGRYTKEEWSKIKQDLEGDPS